MLLISLLQIHGLDNMRHNIYPLPSSPSSCRVGSICLAALYQWRQHHVTLPLHPNILGQRWRFHLFRTVVQMEIISWFWLKILLKIKKKKGCKIVLEYSAINNLPFNLVSILSDIISSCPAFRKTENYYCNKTRNLFFHLFILHFQHTFTFYIILLLL